MRFKSKSFPCDYLTKKCLYSELLNRSLSLPVKYLSRREKESNSKSSSQGLELVEVLIIHGELIPTLQLLSPWKLCREALFYIGFRAIFYLVIFSEAWMERVRFFFFSLLMPLHSPVLCISNALIFLRKSIALQGKCLSWGIIFCSFLSKKKTVT